jgi:hypothetical protein
MTPSATRTLILAMLLVLPVLSACHTVEPVEEELLIVEAFLDTGKPLPDIVLRRSLPPGSPYPSDSTVYARGAVLKLVVDGRTVSYVENPSVAGRYVPERRDPIEPGTVFGLRAEWKNRIATASGSVPPAISIDSVKTRVPARPVRAVLLDSLRFDTLSTGAQTVFIYPVEVTVFWTVLEAGQADSLHWVRPHLRPYSDFSSATINFFLRPEQVLREDRTRRENGHVRSWTGVYAVRARNEDDPMEPHSVKVSLLRSGIDYARFASSKDSPQRREPVSNVTGGLGIAAGVSVDSLRLEVRR